MGHYERFIHGVRDALRKKSAAHLEAYGERLTQADIAEALHVHPTHLSGVLNLASGRVASMDLQNRILKYLDMSMEDVLAGSLAGSRRHDERMADAGNARPGEVLQDLQAVSSDLSRIFRQYEQQISDLRSKVAKLEASVGVDFDVIDLRYRVALDEAHCLFFIYDECRNLVYYNSEHPLIFDVGNRQMTTLDSVMMGARPFLTTKTWSNALDAQADLYRTQEPQEYATESVDGRTFRNRLKPIIDDAGTFRGMVATISEVEK